jgi:hypothetical protein
MNSNTGDSDDSGNARDAEDLLVGGGGARDSRRPGVGVFLVNGNATLAAWTRPPDVKDVVQDYNENRSAGAISSYGSAPAVR